MKKQHVQLTATDQDYLETLISKGELKARSYRRALGLLELDRGKTYTDVRDITSGGTYTFLLGSPIPILSGSGGGISASYQNSPGARQLEHTRY